MPIDANGFFYPSLFPKQLEVLAACRPSKKNLVFLNGPRWCSKTQVCHHAVCQHAWNTNRGNIGVISYTQSVGLDSGVWQHLTETFLQDWIDGDFGMEWVKKPYIQNVTKKPACIVSNKWGNKTKISLESLKDEKEVESRFKGREYSMIWVNELTKFKERKTFDTLKQCFRGNPHLGVEDYLFLADFNPDLDLGTASPWYKLLYMDRTMDDPPPELVPLLRSINLIEMNLDDNLSLSEEKKQSLMADFSYSEDILNAYYYGKWSNSSENAIFHRVFRPNFHVVKDLTTESDCFELQTGLDPGVTNCAVVIGEKIIPDKVQYPKYDGKPIFKVLQEQVIIGEDFELYDFIEQLLKKMDYWEEVIGRPGKTMWTHWSDRSVYDMKIPFLDRVWASEILMASNNRLRLIAAARGKGSVQVRIDLVRKLLFEERLFVDEENCPQVIEMFKSLKKGRTVAAGIERGSRHKHIFDALSYWLVSECVEELSMSLLNRVRGDEKTASLSQVAL